MKKIQKLFLAGIIVSVIAGLVMCFTFDINPITYLASLGGGIGGVSLAAIAVVGKPVNDGVVSVDSLDEAGILMQDVSDEITKISPSRFPLDTIARNVKRTEKVESQEFKFYQKSSKPMADKIKVSASGNGLSYSTPCSSYTAPTTGEGVLKIYVAVETPQLWRISDTILMKELTLQGNANERKIGAAGTIKYDVMFYVTGKESNSLELMAIGGMKGTGANANEWVIPSFTSSTLLVRMGQAKSETELTTNPIALHPEPSIQFCQNYITQVEENTFAAMSKKEVQVGITDYERDNLEAMRGEMELSQLYGEKALIRNEKGERIYFTGGILRQITKVCEYGTGTAGDRSMTKEQYSAMLRSVFTGNNGSSERMLFAGSKLIESLELLRESQKMTQGSVSESYLGVIVTKIVSQFGVLRICYAPAFDEIGMPDGGVIIDVSHLCKREFLPMVAKELDLKSSGIKNAKAKTLQEVSALILRYPDCHAIVRPKAV